MPPIDPNQPITPKIPGPAGEGRKETEETAPASTDQPQAEVKAGDGTTRALVNELSARLGISPLALGELLAGDTGEDEEIKLKYGIGEDRSKYSGVVESARGIYRKERGKEPPPPEEGGYILYGKLCRLRYKQIRTAKEPYNVSVDTARKAAYLKTSDKIEINDNFGDKMVYRYPKDTASNTLRYSNLKYSMNLTVCEGLIKTLDDFVLKYSSSYKIDVINYRIRHDSVNLYPDNDLSPEVERELAEITKPYVRGENLIGSTISDTSGTPYPGIRKEIEPTGDEINTLIEKCNGLDPDLANAAHIIATDYLESSVLAISRAQFVAIEGLYNDLCHSKVS